MSVAELSAHAKWSRFDRLDDTARKIEEAIAHADHMRRVRSARAWLRDAEAQHQAAQTYLNGLLARGFL